ncbi:hypothetical protein IGI04_010233 [Brassica rapa subsp. trilocularis]|uniref:Uncharacterized protein n=1 Tax=Brassica rapa subsp. trilocularis TaxID=1813537 RepID=A0ABQ7N301_BRACM|nr:hypothetical protein IGI04_010233 [Brassica rapa subsp. trilocularis]
MFMLPKRRCTIGFTWTEKMVTNLGEVPIRSKKKFVSDKLYGALYSKILLPCHEFFQGKLNFKASVFLCFHHVTLILEHDGLNGSNGGRRRCRTFLGFERRRRYLINKETTKKGIMLMLTKTVTNPQVEMVPLLQTALRLWRSGNMMKDDYGYDDKEEP